MNYKLKQLIENYDKEINILHVEDSLETIEATNRILNRYFSNIYSAKNGEEALKLINSKTIKFDLIITDLDMPIMDGISMIEYVREKNKDIYIVVFSVQNDPEYFIETINYGINGYILKPFKLVQFMDMAIKFMKHLYSKNKIYEKNIINLINDFKWDKKNKILLKDKESIKLTKNETKLFETLSLNLGVHTAKELGSFIFKEYDDNDNIKIRNLLSKLKTKLKISLVDSIYAEGYKLKATF
jgi:DNA-binding response OmpR family regulator